MSTPSIFKLRFTVPSATSNGSQGAEGKSYILTLALSIEAEAEEMSCSEQIGLELLPSFWMGGTSEEPSTDGSSMPATDPTPDNGIAPVLDPDPGAH